MSDISVDEVYDKIVREYNKKKGEEIVSEIDMK